MITRITEHQVIPKRIPYEYRDLQRLVTLTGLFGRSVAFVGCIAYIYIYIHRRSRHG